MLRRPTNLTVAERFQPRIVGEAAPASPPVRGGRMPQRIVTISGFVRAMSRNAVRRDAT
jgi:hypothetical protein